VFNGLSVYLRGEAPALLPLLLSPEVQLAGKVSMCGAGQWGNKSQENATLSDFVEDVFSQVRSQSPTRRGRGNYAAFPPASVRSNQPLLWHPAMVGSLLLDMDSQMQTDSKHLAESANISGDATGCGRGTHPLCKA